MNKKKISNKQKLYEVSLLDIFNFIIALASLVVAIIALINSKQIEMDVADYEFTLSQMPKVCFLNQEIQIPLQSNYKSDNYTFNSHSEELDFSKLSIDNFPLKLPIYNIGTGLAQNCKVELNTLNQKNMILDCREIFNICNLNTYYSDDNNFARLRLETYLSDYIYCFVSDELIYIEYRVNGEQEYHREFDTDCVEIFPYILPISEEKEEFANYFKLPDELSIFILEALHQEMSLPNDTSPKPISLKMSINYQDLKNNDYSLEYLLKFSLVSKSVSNKESIMRIQLSVEEIKK